MKKFIASSGGVIAFEANPKFNNVAFVTKMGELTLCRLNEIGWEPVWSVNIDKQQTAALAGMCWRPDGSELLLVLKDGQGVFYSRETSSNPRYEQFVQLENDNILFAKWLCVEKKPRDYSDVEAVAQAFPQVSHALGLIVGKDKVSSKFRANLVDLQCFSENTDCNLLFLATNSGTFYVFADGATRFGSFKLPASGEIDNIASLFLHNDTLHIALLRKHQAPACVVRSVSITSRAREAQFQIASEKGQGLCKLFALLQVCTLDLCKEYSDFKGLHMQYASRMEESMGASHGPESLGSDIIITELLEAFLTGRPEPALQHFLLHKLKEQGLNDWISHAKEISGEMQSLLVQFLIPGWTVLGLCLTSDVYKRHLWCFGDYTALTEAVLYVQQRLDAILKALQLESDIFHAFASWLRQAFVDASGEAIEHYYYEGPMDEAAVVYIENCLPHNKTLDWLFEGSLNAPLTKTTRPEPSEWIQDDLEQILGSIGAEFRSHELSSKSLDSLVSDLDAQFSSQFSSFVFAFADPNSISDEFSFDKLGTLNSFCSSESTLLLASVSDMKATCVSFQKLDLSSTLKKSVELSVNIANLVSDSADSRIQSLYCSDLNTLVIVQAIFDKENQSIYHVLSEISVVQSNAPKLLSQTTLPPNYLTMMTASTPTEPSTCTLEFKIKAVCPFSRFLAQPVFVVKHLNSGNLIVIDGGRKRLIDIQM